MITIINNNIMSPSPHPAVLLRPGYRAAFSLVLGYYVPENSCSRPDVRDLDSGEYVYRRQDRLNLITLGNKMGKCQSRKVCNCTLEPLLFNFDLGVPSGEWVKVSHSYSMACRPRA